MSYNIRLSDNFKKEAKRLIKKYKSLKAEITLLGSQLQEDPTLGTHLGDDVYKIRLAVKSKGKGKSGGVRILTLVKVSDTEVILLSIYNKGEKETVSDSEIKTLLSDIF